MVEINKPAEKTNKKPFFVLITVLIVGIIAVIYMLSGGNDNAGVSGEQADVSVAEESSDDSASDQVHKQSVTKPIDKAPLHGGQIYKSNAVVVPFKRSSLTDFPVRIQDDKDEKNAPGEGN
ncbi:MAG: hypothetical protein HZA48_05385 [Planctomycetes bacterium]|nr:hypothetical protein [Planctomycetota bacterium]